MKKYKVMYIQPYVKEVLITNTKKMNEKGFKLYKVVPVFGTGMMMHQIKGLVLIFKKT